MNQRELASIEAESSIHTSRVATFAEKTDSHVNIIKNANAQIEKLQQQVADSSTAIDMFRDESQKSLKALSSLDARREEIKDRLAAGGSRIEAVNRQRQELEKELLDIFSGHWATISM